MPIFDCTLSIEGAEEVMVISDLLSRLRALFRRKPMEAELDEDAHFERGVGK